MVSRLLRPSAVVLATFTAAKTDDVNSKSSRKISELPIYSTEEVKYLEYKAPERTELEEYIARVRRKVWTFGENVEEHFVSMKKRYMMVKDKVIEYSNVITQTADTEENIIPKVAAVSLVGVISFAAAGSSRMRQILLPLVGSTAMAAVCFPTITNQVLVKPGVQVYHQLREQLIQLKDKATHQVSQQQVRHVETPEEKEIVEIVGHRESEDTKAVEVEDKHVVDEQKDVVLSVSDTESRDNVLSIQGDFGQSDPSDSDMYSHHSTK